MVGSSREHVVRKPSSPTSMLTPPSLGTDLLSFAGYLPNLLKYLLNVRKFFEKFTRWQQKNLGTDFWGNKIWKIFETQIDVRTFCFIWIFIQPL